MLRGAGGGAGGVNSYVPSTGNLPFRTTVPLCWPSNGTAMSSTGVFTLAAALPYNPQAGFMYLPANLLFPGSSLGFWYTQFTSASGGTVFTNFYGGTGAPLPSLPASPSGLVGGTGGAWSTPTTNVSFGAITPTTLSYLAGSTSYVEVYAAFSCVGATARTFTWYRDTIATPLALSSAAITTGVTACGGYLLARPCPSGFVGPQTGILMAGGSAAQYGTAASGANDNFSGSMVNSLIGVGSTTVIAGATDSCICEMMYMLIYP